MSVQNNSEPSTVPARLIETAIGLARAEMALVLAHAREIAVRAVSALLVTIVAGAFAQLAVVIIILSPILVKVVPIENLILALVLPLVVALVGAVGALLSWKSVHRSLHASSTPPVSGRKHVDVTAAAPGGGTHQPGAAILAGRASQ
jgi:hypothetical protein